MMGSNEIVRQQEFCLPGAHARSIDKARRAGAEVHWSKETTTILTEGERIKHSARSSPSSP